AWREASGYRRGITPCAFAGRKMKSEQQAGEEREHRNCAAGRIRGSRKGKRQRRSGFAAEARRGERERSHGQHGKDGRNRQLIAHNLRSCCPIHAATAILQSNICKNVSRDFTAGRLAAPMPRAYYETMVEKFLP